jgi:hypothetical protein
VPEFVHTHQLRGALDSISEIIETLDERITRQDQAFEGLLRQLIRIEDRIGDGRGAAGNNVNPPDVEHLTQVVLRLDRKVLELEEASREKEKRFSLQLSRLENEMRHVMQHRARDEWAGQGFFAANMAVA